ncbi:MAG: hypothetical protein AAGG55_09425 [Pseudomonadota bacterium]
MAETGKKRVRLSRVARREMTLDHAAAIGAEEGVSSVTMEAAGRSMSASNSPRYACFPTITELLRALLDREYRRLRTGMINRVSATLTALFAISPSVSR